MTEPQIQKAGDFSSKMAAITEVAQARGLKVKVKPDGDRELGLYDITFHCGTACVAEFHTADDAERWLQGALPASVLHAAQWLATMPTKPDPLIPHLRREFDLTPREAIDAIREANLIKARAH